MLTAIISALAAIIASAGAIILTKQKEREAAWRAKKLSYYGEFFGAASGVAVRSPPQDAKVRFAMAVNNLHLIASADVIPLLHALTDEIAPSNAANMTKERHDELWSKLVWHIRADLGDAPGDPSTFKARLYESASATKVSPLPVQSGMSGSSLQIPSAPTSSEPTPRTLPTASDPARPAPIVER